MKSDTTAKSEIRLNIFIIETFIIRRINQLKRSIKNNYFIVIRKYKYV